MVKKYRTYDFNIAELSRVHGVHEKTIRARLDSGISLDEALSPIDRRAGNGSNQACVYKWNGLSGLPEISRYVGVSVPTMGRYIKRAGGDIDKAVEEIEERRQQALMEPKKEQIIKRDMPRPPMSAAMKVALGLV